MENLNPRKAKDPNPVPVSEFYNFFNNTEIDLPNITDFIQHPGT